VFDTLIVSNPEGKGIRRGVPGTMWSIVLHTVLIFAAVKATMKAEQIVQDVIADTTMVFLTEEQEPEPEPEPEEPQPQQIVSLNPPPKGFQTVDAPIDIPTDIPPIDLSERFDPRDFTGTGVEGGVFSGVEGGTGPVDLSQTFLEAAVDEPPERLSGPNPRYPEMLRQAGIEGQVVLEFVIDTTGRVEENSIKILNSTNKAFEGPARDVIQRSIYRPGRVRGVAVRVLVQQAISFNIQREDEEE
jgi:periplasmic protein TonB